MFWKSTGENSKVLLTLKHAVTSQEVKWYLISDSDFNWSQNFTITSKQGLCFEGYEIVMSIGFLLSSLKQIPIVLTKLTIAIRIFRVASIIF